MILTLIIHCTVVCMNWEYPSLYTRLRVLYNVGVGWGVETGETSVCATLCNILQLEKRKWEVQTLMFHQKIHWVISLFKFSDKNSQDDFMGAALCLDWWYCQATMTSDNFTGLVLLQRLGNVLILHNHKINGMNINIVVLHFCSHPLSVFFTWTFSFRSHGVKPPASILATEKHPGAGYNMPDLSNTTF